MDEIPVSDLSLKDLESLKKRTFQIMSNKLIEYKASWIRND
jgi:hypothetical protein